MTVTTGVRLDGTADVPHWDAVVIGAGLGGLSTAAFLATHGQRVLVLEQHHVVGGRSQVFRRSLSTGTGAGAGEETYEFDVGVHHVGECQPGGRVRTALGALGLDDRIEWHQLDPDGFFTVTLPDVQVRVPVGWDAYEQRLTETFPDEADALRRCTGVLRAAAQELRAPRRPGLLGPVRRLAGRRTLLRWGLRPLASLFDACGLSERARTVIAAQCGDYSAPPSTATVGLHASALDHLLVSGAWYPRGGGQVVAARLAEVIRAHGGEVRTGVRVDRVLMEGGRAVGVTLVDGTELHADAVVSDADPKRTYLGLVGREHLPAQQPRRAEQMVPALPLFTVHLALDHDVSDQLPRSTQWIHPQPDLEAFYEAVHAGRTGGPVPVLMTSGAFKDPTGRSAPSGRSTLQLVTVASSRPGTWGLRAGGPSAGEKYSDLPAYLAAKERLVEACLDTAETVLPALRRHIVHREASTPVTHERITSAWAGTAHGLAVSRDQVGPFRVGVTSPIRGLFLTGAGTTDLPGVASTLLGGLDTAGAVLGRDLHAEVAAGRTYASPDALPADGPDWDPLAVSGPR